MPLLATLNRENYCAVSKVLKSLKHIIEDSVLWLTPQGLICTFLNGENFFSYTMIDKCYFTDYEVHKNYAFKSKMNKAYLLDFLCCPKRDDFISATFSVTSGAEEECYSLTININYDSESITYCKPSVVENTDILHMDENLELGVILESYFLTELFAWMGPKNRNVGPFSICLSQKSMNLSFEQTSKCLPALTYRLVTEVESPADMVETAKKKSSKKVKNTKSILSSSKSLLVEGGQDFTCDDRRVNLNAPLDFKRLVSAYKINKCFMPKLVFMENKETLVVIQMVPQEKAEAQLSSIYSYTIFFQTSDTNKKRRWEESWDGPSPKREKL